MMKGRPRILVIDNSIAVTGALKAIVRSANDLKGDFSFSFVIPIRNNTGTALTQNGFSYTTLRMVEISKRIASMIMYFPMLFVNGLRLKTLLRRDAIDIVHVNDLYNLLPVAARLLGSHVPYVCHVRFVPDRFPSWLLNWWMRLHLRYAARIIAVSNAVSSKLPSNPKIITIPDGLHGSERLPESVDKKGAPYFLYLANYIHGKGQDHALRAFQKVHELLPAWKLRFVGSDMGLKKNAAWLQSLKDLALSYGVANKTEWKGFTNDVEAEYKNADIVLNFSESEAFPLTCLEALFFGRPLIATKCGGPSEIVNDRVTGLLVENKDIDSMASAMITLANDGRSRDDLAKRARVDMRERFGVGNTSMRLKEVYNLVLGLNK